MDNPIVKEVTTSADKDGLYLTVTITVLYDSKLGEDLLKLQLKCLEALHKEASEQSTKV